MKENTALSDYHFKVMQQNHIKSSEPFLLRQRQKN